MVTNGVDKVREQVLRRDGVLVRVNPIQDGAFRCAISGVPGGPGAA